MEVVTAALTTMLQAAFVLLLSCLLNVSLLRLLVYLTIEEEDYVRPCLHCRPSLLSQMLIKSVTGLSQRYHVPKWRSLLLHLSSPSISACFLVCCSKWPTAVHFNRQCITLSDSTTVTQLDWVVIQNSKQHGGAGVVVIVLDDSCNQGTLLLFQQQLHSMCQSLVDHGYTPVVYRHQTSCGTLQMRKVVQYLSSRYPQMPLAIVASSLSASLVISYLGEFGSSSLVHAAVAISPLWEFEAEQQQTNNPLADADDIAVPLLVVHYDDDPVVPKSSVPHDLFTLYPHLLLVTCPIGGHCGQIQSTPLIDLILVDFLSTIFGLSPLKNKLHSRII